MADEQDHRALARAGVAHKFRDFRGEIDKAAPGGLNGQQRGHDGVRVDRGWRSPRERFGRNHEFYLSVVPAKAGTHTPRPLDFGRSELIPSKNNQQRWVPAFAGTTLGGSAAPLKSSPSPPSPSP